MDKSRIKVSSDLLKHIVNRNNYDLPIVVEVESIDCVVIGIEVRHHGEFKDSLVLKVTPVEEA